MDYSLPGSSVYVSQARILVWVVISFSKRSFQPRNWTCISCITGRFFFFKPLSNQGSPFSFYSVLAIFHSFHFIHIAMGMSVPLILITGWTLLHVSNSATVLCLSSPKDKHPGCQRSFWGRKGIGKKHLRWTDSNNTFLYPSKIMVCNHMCVRQQGLEMFFPP